MKSLRFFYLLLLSTQAISQDGDGQVTVSGDLQTWHTVTLTINGPFAKETDSDPNPFTDYDLTATFTHESGSPSYTVPGYFAADGKAAETSAESGNQWRVHLSPDKEGKWSYRISFRAKDKALPGDGREGDFTISESDKSPPDFRARGRLTYVGRHHLQFAGDKTWFLKAGPDAPETFLAYRDFDGTEANKSSASPLKSWEPHVKDWKEGDPTWQEGKGKGMIGALNYLSAKGLNVFSFLTYNAGGDGDNVWPFRERNDKLHYDCSKLDQWGIVFDHARSQGLYLHFKLQETENDDNRRGQKGEKKDVPESLDGGALGPERKLYLRELIARYSHHLALNWNVGEENTQSTEEVIAMANYIRENDPYHHPIVIHTYPNWQDKVYPPLLGEKSALTGASLQNDWSQVHQRTLQWVEESAKAGKPWVVANDEQGPADLGVPPDPGYEGFSGTATGKDKGRTYDLTDIRRNTLWGNLMAGGAGVEYYFGYKLPQNDLRCEDYHSRDRSWDFCRAAIQFFHQQQIPFWEMKNANDLVGNSDHKNGKPWCLTKVGEVYLVYLPAGTKADLTLADTDKGFSLSYFSISDEIEPSGDSMKVSPGLPVPLEGTEDGDRLALIRAKQE